MVFSAKAKNSPQGSLEIPVSIKVEWENEIKLEDLKTKVLNLAYSLEVDYVDESKEILDEYLKDSDCEVPGNDDEVVECVETEKDTELVVWMN